MSRTKAGKRALPSRHPYLTTAVSLLAGIILAVVVLVNLFTHILPVVRYYGDGMEPSLHSGQLLVLLKTEQVEEGDAVAFYYNNKILVRRVICTGGRYIDIKQDGTVYIEGALLDEPYVEEASLGQCNLDFPCYVPPDHIFVMGDRRTTAMDSRLEEIGPIPTDRILGKVILDF